MPHFWTKKFKIHEMIELVNIAGPWKIVGNQDLSVTYLQKSCVDERFSNPQRLGHPGQDKRRLGSGEKRANTEQTKRSPD